MVATGNEGIGSWGASCVGAALVGLAGCLAVGCTVLHEYDECRIPGQCLRENTLALCTDAQDNDEDGLTDCADPGCQAHCTEDDETWCADGRDNDGDALVDCEDPGCGQTAHCGENTDAKCSDGLDNNLDGPLDCADPQCCVSRVCHEQALCGEPVFETDFRQGPDPDHWIEHHASSGYRGEGNALTYGPEGLELRARSHCYGWGEETGVISTVPLDLTTGRFFIEAELRVPPQSYWPAALMLIPHPRTGRFVLRPGNPGAFESCGEPMSTADATPAQTPTLILDVFSDGSRRLSTELGDERIFHPGGGVPYPVIGQRDTWRVRLDIDDEDVVLLDHDGVGWNEVARVDNPLPGRELYLALLAGTDSSQFAHQMLVRRVAVSHYPRSRWSVRYAEDFETEPEPSWETNNPARCRWDAARGTLDATWVADSEEYCLVTLPEPWTGESFRLRYDLWVDRQDNGTGFIPALYDAGRSYDHSSRIGAGFGHPDAGLGVETVFCDSWERALRPPSTVLSRWLRVELVHDARRALVEASVIDRETREAVVERTAWDIKCPLDLVYFGLTTMGFNRETGRTVHGRVDNVELRVKDAPAGGEPTGGAR